MLVSGALAATKYGWPMIFYVYGLSGVLVSVLFAVLGHNSPAVDPTISEAERYYIQNSLGHTEKKHVRMCFVKSKIDGKTSWKLISVSQSPIQSYSNLGTSMGTSNLPVWEYIWILDSTHANPNLHEVCSKLQH